MKGTFFVVEGEALLNNKVFSNDPLFGMKSDNYMYVHLREVLKKQGITLDTQDILAPEEADFIICQNTTKFFRTYKRSKNNKFIYLILTEPPVYNLEDWDPNNHSAFDKVFTYNPDLVDDIKYFKFTFPIDFPERSNFELVDQKQFDLKKHCCMIAAAISTVPHSSNLQSLLFERYKAIKWFNNIAPLDLDLYARRHPLHFCMSFRGASLIEKFVPSLRKRIAQKTFDLNIKKVYKGAIPPDEKLNYLNKYKFSLCFENTYGMKGLISEKIFDCFMGMNVPIYCGAPDIDSFIPKDCFIDLQEFKSYEELNRFLHSITFEQYEKYQIAIMKFLNGDGIIPFTVTTFSNLFVNHISKELEVEVP